MSIFDFHANVLKHYQQYVRRFLSISDESILEFVERKLLEESVLWPDALIQLNPACQQAETVDELVHSRLLLPATASIFRTVLRLSPNSRAACRTLMPSACTARRTRAYTFTEYTPQVSQKHTTPVLFDCLPRGGLLFDRHQPPLRRRLVVHYCSTVLKRSS